MFDRNYIRSANPWWPYASIRGMRIPVFSHCRPRLHMGFRTTKSLEDYPDLEREDIEQAVAYAAWADARGSEESLRTLAMKFLADMGVSMRVVNWLRRGTHDVVHLRERGLQRLPDVEIFKLAASEQRIILTFDLDLRRNRCRKW